MTLTVQNQLTLLYDILSEQSADNSGSINEYQQIKRLVQALIAQNKITDEQLLQLLPEIYHYGLQGETAQSLTEHIKSNEQNIQTWKQAIEQMNLS